MILKTRSGLDISPVFNASAVLVLSFVGVIFQELVRKITVRNVQFKPVEFRLSWRCELRGHTPRKLCGDLLLPSA